MKFGFKKSIALWNTLGGVFILMLSFQNCSKAKFTIDPAAKSEAVSGANILGGDKESITDTTPGDDGSIAGPRPGDDTGAPKDTAPSMPSMPSMPSIPGLPSSGGGKPNTITFARMCTFGDGSHASKMLWDNTSEVKLLFTASDNKTILCEVDNIRQQIINKKPVDISSCKGLPTGSPIFVVEMSVTSNFPANNIAFEGSVYQGELSSIMPVNLNYTTSNDSANAKNCESDDPLLIQLNTRKPKPIVLTAPEQGVMFDLLGQMIKPAHEKVLTSWFAESETENYFLALPNSQGQVLGIDQLFGNSTRGPDGEFASHGFAALAKYDEDRDGLMTAEDSVFSELRLWKDANRDGIAQSDELFTLEEKGVIVIDLRFDPRYREKDQHGNMVKYKSVVKMKDNSYGLVYDLWLKFLIR
jgi:hypothetical protein